MSYGYGLSMTPLQILTFYNSIANDGEMVGPKFIYSYKKPGSTNEVIYEKEFWKICFFKKTNNILKQMLYDVVHHENGTAKI